MSGYRDCMNEVRQKAFEMGGLEDGSYHLEDDELEHLIRLALSQQAEPKCGTCNDVGIVGHSTICPGCEDTWTPPDEQTAPQPEQSGLVDTWAGVKAIPVSCAEYAAIYRNTWGLAPKSVKPGDGMTARSGVSYVVSASPAAQEK